MSDRDEKQQFNKRTRYTCSSYCAHAHNAQSLLRAADNGVSTIMSEESRELAGTNEKDEDT